MATKANQIVRAIALLDGAQQNLLEIHHLQALHGSAYECLCCIQVDISDLMNKLFTQLRREVGSERLEPEQTNDPR